MSTPGIANCINGTRFYVVLLVGKYHAFFILFIQLAYATYPIRVNKAVRLLEIAAPIMPILKCEMKSQQLRKWIGIIVV